MPNDNDVRADRDVRQLCFEMVYRKPIPISVHRRMEDIQECGLSGFKTSKEMYDRLRYKIRSLISRWPESVKNEFMASFRANYRSMIMSRDVRRYVNFVYSFSDAVLLLPTRIEQSELA